MYLDVKIVIITSSEVSGELQDGVTILLLTTDQEPILTFINRGKVTINGKAILQYGSRQIFCMHINPHGPIRPNFSNYIENLEMVEATRAMKGLQRLRDSNL